MNDALQQIVFFVFLVIWVGGAFVMGFRTYAAEQRYLRHLPPVEGIPLEMHGYPLGPVWRAIVRAIWCRQDDPDLEQLRRAYWRRYRSTALWVFGFPLLMVAVLVALILSSQLKLT